MRRFGGSRVPRVLNDGEPIRSFGSYVSLAKRLPAFRFTSESWAATRLELTDPVGPVIGADGPSEVLDLNLQPQIQPT